MKIILLLIFLIILPLVHSISSLLGNLVTYYEIYFHCNECALSKGIELCIGANRLDSSVAFVQ